MYSNNNYNVLKLQLNDIKMYSNNNYNVLELQLNILKLQLKC